MAKSKNSIKVDSFEKANGFIDSKIDKMRLQLEKMDPARYMLAEKELHDYWWLYFHCEVLRTQIENEGLLIEGVENPNLGILHKLEGRKSTIFSKIMQWLPKEESDEEDRDALDDFLNLDE